MPTAFEERLVRNERVLGHGGGFPGVSTQLEMYLDKGYTVVVLTNIDTLGMPAVVVKVRVLLEGQQKAAAFKKKIDIGGHGLYIDCSAALAQGGPTVVLEAGLNQDADTWNKVQPEVARFARVCSYDRAGLGTSDAPQRQVSIRRKERPYDPTG